MASTTFTKQPDKMKLNKVPHYSSPVEVIEYLEANLTEDEFRGVLKGNIIKYVTRFRKKGGVADLDKAKEYLVWLTELETNGHVFFVRKEDKAPF